MKWLKFVRQVDEFRPRNCIRSFVQYGLAGFDVGGRAAASVIPMEDGLTRIELRFAGDFDPDQWTEVADHFHRLFSGEHRSDFEHISFDANDTGTFVSYVVRSKT